MTDLADMKPYWMVHGGGPPTHRHATYGEAVAEAERLARRYPGETFVVLEAIEAIRKVDLERIRLHPPSAKPGDDIPF